MSDATASPKCRLCGTSHPLGAPHNYEKVVQAASKPAPCAACIRKDKRIAELEKQLAARQNPVTQPLDVTKKPPMTNAERQRAFRDRQRAGS